MLFSFVNWDALRPTFQAAMSEYVVILFRLDYYFIFQLKITKKELGNKEGF